MSYKKSILRCSYVVLATFFVLNSVAQGLEEVVVTATKKEESTQDLAISVEAFTSEMLEQNQIYDSMGWDVTNFAHIPVSHS